MYNLLIGGAAGQGVDSLTLTLEMLIKRAGCGLFTMRDLMSRIRGGHNFSRIRFGAEAPAAHAQALDGIIALNQETIDLHLGDLKPEGFVLFDKALKCLDPRAMPMGLMETAKDLGNERAFSSVAAGAALKLLGISLDEEGARHSFSRSLKPALVELNVKAALAGRDAVEQRLPPVGGGHAGDMLLSGSQALSLGAMRAGLQFYSAYPMSPSTAILEYLAHSAQQVGFLVEQAEDEIAAISLAIGASFAGARAMTGTSGGGFSLMVESLGLAGMIEVPLVIVDAQRAGPATGLPTRTEQSDLKFVISAAQGEFPRMVIALRSHEDAYYQTIRAFTIAEKYQIPVILLTDQFLQDSTATVPLFKSPPEDPPAPDMIPQDEEYARYRYTESGISPRLFPGDKRGFAAADSDEHDEMGHIIEDAQTRAKMMDKRMGKLELLKEELLEPELLGAEDAEMLLIGWGSMRGSIMEALDLLNSQPGGRYGALVFGDVWPLPQTLLVEKAQKARVLINVEQNYTGQLASLIRQETGIAMHRSVLRYDGRQLTGADIFEKVMKETKQ